MFPAGFLVDADNFRGLGRVQRFYFVRSPDALASDDEVVLAAKLSAHFGDGGAHAARVLFIAKIKKGLTDEWSGMQARTRWSDGGF
jgi:hypothetical protein